jgi:hypothetical protein
MTIFAASNFTRMEAENLRTELLQGNIDCFQAKEIVKAFFIGRGYGISTDAATTIYDTMLYPDSFKATLEIFAAAYEN